MLTKIKQIEKILNRVGLPICSVSFSNTTIFDVLFKWKFGQQWGWVDLDQEICFVFNPNLQQFQPMKKGN